MTPSFPLLQLPSRAIKNALKHFDVPELIIFSTLSNRAKNLVKSDKRDAPIIEVFFYIGCINIPLSTPTTIMFGESRQRECDIESLTPCPVRVIDERTLNETSFTVPGFHRVRDWLVHFMNIFNVPMIDIIFLSRDAWKYSLESVRNVVKGFTIGHVAAFENACEVIKHFPIMNSLHVDKADSDPELQGADLNFIKKLFIGNIPSLCVSRVIPIDLNTLLMMNSPDITVYRTTITEKELNTFLKLWLKGASSNLQSLHIDFVEHRCRDISLDLSVIMKGIEIKKSNDEKTDVPKYDIWKSDGTLADVTVLNYDFYFNVRH
ncbi:hypothetical protein CAEBREN_30829 [Caenorhabditis brenneri]|uniref:F-box domain-containing protein n=1 Tax=Caenorhabditis brenneri TaxID=135651 RepID=G0N3G6_CAEBE|nr:hypothetical protein CAEBREN_30829 [Caenorhabditis brenneri]